MAVFIVKKEGEGVHAGVEGLTAALGRAVREGGKRVGEKKKEVVTQGHWG